MRDAVYTGHPFTVSINEAVELAKKFDHEKAPAFINGVLNKSCAEVEGIKARDSPKMSVFIGFDISNYTTSAAAVRDGEIVSVRIMLSVAEGERGLRQSDALFFAYKNLPEVPRGSAATTRRRWDAPMRCATAGLVHAVFSCGSGGSVHAGKSAWRASL